MKIGFKNIDQPVKTLIVDGEEYQFTNLFLSDEIPMWKVILVDGQIMYLNLGKAKWR